MELSKYFNSETMEVPRSGIRLSGYNPRTISDEGRRQLRRSIKRYGVVGGIVVNKRTGNTIVGGHQKVKILDDLNGYPDNDYSLKVEMVDVDERTEKQMNIVLNNPNVGGQWDFDALARIVPDIDYKEAGLTEADLNLIGCDFLLRTEGENDIAGEMDEMMRPVTDMREEEKARREAERLAEREAKVAHMRDVKRQVDEKARRDVNDMDAYVMLSFDTYKAKAAFCERFGYAPDMKFIKGEVFGASCERVYDDD